MLPRTNPTNNNATLYVGDLAPDVTEALLYETFNKAGPILSIRVCRDSSNKRSLGYAYVNFVHSADAERAREALNYSPIHGRPIRIMWCQKDPNLRRQGKGNIIIKNLHPKIDNPTLYDTFSQFGNILSCKVEVDDRTGESKGMGFVHFESETAAAQAAEKVDGMLLAGRCVVVQPFIPRSERIEHNKEHFTKLEVKGIRDDSEEEPLKEFFSKYGEVERVRVFKNRKEEAFAFIDFTTHEDAKKAVDELHESHVEELCKAACEGEPQPVLSVQRSLTKAERKEEHQKKRAAGPLSAPNAAENSSGGLYVGNLHNDVDDGELGAAFAEFGELVRVQVMMTRHGTEKKSRGFGFVCFKTAAQAEAARKAMHNKSLHGRNIIVNRAQSRGKEQGPPGPMPGPKAGRALPVPVAPGFPALPYPMMPASMFAAAGVQPLGMYSPQMQAFPAGLATPMGFPNYTATAARAGYPAMGVAMAMPGQASLPTTHAYRNQY